MANSFISIGESVHASIPRTSKVMKQLAELGTDAYKVPSEPLDYIKALIESQVAEGADYIAVNLDAFGESDPQITVDMMTEYVKMVRNWSNGVPICIDSSDDNVLIAGLKEWYNSDESVKQPLINSIKSYTIDKLMPLKKDFDYSFVGLLVGEEKSSAIEAEAAVAELYSLAKQIFDAAANTYGFKPGEMIFDPMIYPLSIDMPMQPGEPSFTYKSFETMKKIRNDADMKGVHITGGVSNSVRDLPGRKIGVMKAYVQTAMRYGLDSGIVNVKNRLYEGQTDPELVELVEAYAKMDGSAEKMTEAMSLMGKFCQQARK